MNRLRFLSGLLFLASADAAAQSATVRRLTLEDAVAIAQKQGLSMRMATEVLESAQWRERSFYGRLLPSVSLTGNAVNLDHGINSITLPDGSTQYIGQSNNQSFAQVTMSQPLLFSGGAVSVSTYLSRTDQFGNLNRQSWQSTPVNIGISQPLFQPRQMLWDKRQQDATTALVHTVFLESREDVALAAVDAFFTLYAADVTTRNAAANASISDTVLRVNRQRYSAANLTQMELGRSELSALRARIDLDNSQIVRDRAEAALRRILKLDDGIPISIVAPEAIPLVAIDPAVAVAEALRNGSTDDQIALDSITVLRATETARFANGLNANLNGGIGFNQTAPDLSNAYQSPLGKQRLSLSVQMPLIQWGSGHAAVEAAKSTQAWAATTARVKRELVAEEARFAALQTTQAMRALGLSAKADTLAATQFAIARAQYAAGNITLTEYLLAQQDKDNGVASHVLALRTFWMQYYALRRITLFDFIKGKRIEE